MPDTLLYSADLASISSSNMEVTPTGGSTQKLADALKTAGGVSGPVAATTLSASGAVTLSPASGNVVVSPTGTVTLHPSVASAMDNMAIGLTTPLAGKFTTITSATDAAVVLTSQTDGAGAGAGTLTNAPSAGNPAIWVPINVNGVLRHFPAW